MNKNLFYFYSGKLMNIVNSYLISSYAYLKTVIHKYASINTVSALIPSNI